MAAISPPGWAASTAASSRLRVDVAPSNPAFEGMPEPCFRTSFIVSRRSRRLAARLGAGR
jgi:hypothetical protein